MLFGRGVWSVFGIRGSSLEAFQTALGDKSVLVEQSQLVASVRTKFGGSASFGINPFAQPRVDELLANQNDLKSLADQLDKNDVKADFWGEYYGSALEQYSLGDNQYAFWVVFNDFEDVTDPKSKQEALAYKEADKPFKFLSKDEKKVIEANVVASAVLSREQFPVLVDFNSETVYVASGNVEQVGVVRQIIAELGGEDFSLAWQFDTPEWPRKFLGTVNDRNKFESDMSARADELTRFRPEEVEKLDDKALEAIVANYFAMSELETGQWAGLSAPARITLGHSYDPVSASHASTAFSVIHGFSKTEIVAASVTFQSLDMRIAKNGDEKPYRTDLFTIDVNDNVNLTDAGAAMLRGFDIPTFKREMKKAAKHRGIINIAEYWKEWLSKMKEAVNVFTDNVTETLKIDKQKFGLKPYAGEAAAEG